MTLPFNNSNSGKRQFVCFVCNCKQFDWASFCEHIRNTHQESRDYVCCPLKRCCAPVRDVRKHFAACHPQEKIPQNCQMKALVWRDTKDIEKRKKKVSFKEGYHISPKNRNKLHYNSGWELTVYKILDKMDDVVTYEVEPLKIEYFFDGERKTYLPDLRVHYTDGTKEILEIKPSNQTGMAVNVAKWEACNEYCQKRGTVFKVITETWIEKMKRQLRIIDIE